MADFDGDGCRWRRISLMAHSVDESVVGDGGRW